MLRGPSSLGTCRCKRRPGSAAPSGGSSRIEHGGDVLLIGVSLAILGLLFCVYTLNRQVIGLKISLSESYEATMGMERVRKVSNLGLEVTLSSLTKLTQDLRGQLASQAENVHTLQLQVRDLRREAGLDPSDGQAFQSTPIGSEASSASLIPSAPLEGGGIGLVNVLSEWTEGRQLPGFEAGCKNISSLYAGDDGDGAEEDGYGRSGGHRLCLDGFRARREEESPGRCLVYDFVVFPRGGSFTKGLQLLGCEVHIFNPVGTEGEFAADENKNQDIHYHRFGAGEQDDGDSQRDNYSSRRAIDSDMRAVLPTRTLASIMRDLGHEGNITVLKLDVRGSNMGFLSQAIDQLGCLPVVQLLLKWRRGRSSARPVEDAIRKLQACGMQQFWAESYAMRNKTTTPEAKAKPLLFDILDFYRPL